MTMVQPTFTEEIVPERYIIMAFTQRCACCRAVHRYSETYSLANLKTTWNLGKRTTNLHRIDVPKYDLPIEVRQQPERTIPFCHSCNEPTLHDLPPAPVPPKQFIGSTLSPPKPTLVKSTTTGGPKAPRPTIADLAELLK